MNRSFSIRSNKGHGGGTSSGGGGGFGKHGFSLTSLRGSIQQPELSKRLFKLIKSENSLVGAHETAARERNSIATQLSEWGEKTDDPAVSDLSDKLGIILAELGEQEDSYAHSLEDSRTVLKRIRNTERSVQPSRDNRTKIADEIAKIKSKEPQSARLVILEQELVRAEAENLVAEAQLVNITRKSLKEAYDAEFAATIERAEKQIILANHGRRLLKLLSDEPVVPGDQLPPYDNAAAGRQVLCDCEDDLRDWRPGYGLMTEDADAAAVRANTKAKSSSGSRERSAKQEDEDAADIASGETAPATAAATNGGGGPTTSNGDNADAEGQHSQLSASSGPRNNESEEVGSPKSQTSGGGVTIVVGGSPGLGEKQVYHLPS